MGSHFCCVLGWCFMERNDYQGAFDCSKSQSTDEERSLIDLKWNASLKTRQRKIYIATFFSPSRISRVFWSQSRTSCRSRFFTMFCKRGSQCWTLMEWAHPFFFFQYWTLISNHPILFGTMKGCCCYWSVAPPNAQIHGKWHGIQKKRLVDSPSWQPNIIITDQMQQAENKTHLT